MPQSLVKMLAHIIFSTKNSADIITTEIEPDFFGYMHGIIENNESKLLLPNGTAVHGHLLSTMNVLAGIESARKMLVTFGDDFVFDSRSVGLRLRLTLRYIVCRLRRRIDF